MKNMIHRLAFSTPLWTLATLALIAGPDTTVADAPDPTPAHVIVLEEDRDGVVPGMEVGAGWRGEVFLDIPEEEVETYNLLGAESFVSDLKPDFTFRTDWIDFPAGPDLDRPDDSFATVGDFLDDYIYEISDPSKLDEPFRNTLIRFTGVLNIRLRDSTNPTDPFGLDVWIDLGMASGYLDGYRVRVPPFNSIIRRVINNNANNLFFHDNAIALALGAFPLEVNYFNHYQPDTPGASAGIEMYSLHGGGLSWPTGEILTHPTRGPATLIPTCVIYQPEQLLDPLPGDFDTDYDVDLLDFQWFQTCYTGPADEGEEFILALGCRAFDFNSDADVDMDDLAAFHESVTGSVTPAPCGVYPGDFAP